MQLVVGRIGRAHGLRGEVTVEVRTDSPDLRFSPGAELFTEPNTGPLKVLTSRWHNQLLLISFENHPDRNSIEGLRNTLLLADVDISAPGESEDDFHDFQLIELAVVNQSGELIGKVREVIHLPAQDLLAIDRGEAPELLIPFVRQFVPTIDLKVGRIVINPPEGLMEDLDEN